MIRNIFNHLMLYSVNCIGPYSLLLYDYLFQVFFVIRLHSVQQAQNLPKIQDPDPLISCDLMDGRDAFLTLAREKHLEFSSLRRAKFSTMCLLFELHNHAKDSFVYTCNNCKAQVETRYHCTVCDVSKSVKCEMLCCLFNCIFCRLLCICWGKNKSIV